MPKRTRYVISIGYEELLIETESTPEEMEDQFLATCLDTGDLLSINGWLIDHAEEYRPEELQPYSPDDWNQRSSITLEN